MALHIDRIVIHNFKSFKHANIGFSNGFNCIAGPNGSGKSNVCDSLLFALGEQSLRRMRVSSSAQLMNDAKAANHTYVKVSFSGNSELEVLREIRGERIVYRLNGKAVTRQEMVDVLRQNNCEINDTNTITQGETAKLLNLNARERRELIDIAAGIREFDMKKEDAMRELEKVESKIGNAHVSLSERVGFLEELEKEKEQALAYTKLAEQIKRTSFTILKLREQQLSSEYTKRFNSYKENDESKKKLEKRTTELDEKISALSKEKEQIAKRLNESSLDISANNRTLEQLNKEMALAESKIESISYNKRDLSERRRKSNSEYEKMKLKFEENEKLAGIAKAKVAGSNIPEMENIEAERLSLDYKGSQQKIEEYTGKRDQLERDHSQMSFDFNSIKAELEQQSAQLSNLQEELSRHENSGASMKVQLKESTESAKTIMKAIEVLQGTASGIRANISRLETENINLREQIAVSSGSSNRINAFLKGSMKSGFHGMASELCTYSEKYALAVSASASSRLNYFVVDSIDVAEQAIKLLNSNKVGRATFIPLKDVKASKPEKKSGMQSMISFIEFEGKFERAFHYLFSDTYLVDSISEAKKQGLGSNRYVTITGEIIERSGIVSGGTAKLQASAPNMEARLKATNAQMEKLRNDLAAIESEISESRRKLSLSESQKVKLDVETGYAANEAGRCASEIEATKAKIKGNKERHTMLSTLMQNASMERDSMNEALKKEKELNSRLYSKLTKSIIGETGGHSSKELERERKEIEDSKLSVAGLSKENSMIMERMREMEKESKETDETLKGFEGEERKTVSSMEKLGKGLAELKEKTKGYDKETQGMYAKMNALDSELSTNAVEKGKLQASVERLNRDILENETAKAQIEVRLGDIKAELSSYQDVNVIEGKRTGELEAELNSGRRELEGMGAVNMKAPELYEKKKKDVEEAQQQMSTLQSEKSSIMEMVNQIESKKFNIFNETLSFVNKNFKELYRHIFEGDAELTVENPKDPFGSGLVVRISIDKKERHMERLSGGEKLLVMLMLIFAIQMMKPMAFYLFDEIDASLDRENSKKLSLLVKELSKRSQFIIVTHNDSIITNANTGIGIAMQNHESRAIGIVVNKS